MIDIECPTCQGAGCYAGNGEPCTMCETRGRVLVTIHGPAPEPTALQRRNRILAEWEEQVGM